MDFKRGISHFKEVEIATTTARQSNNNLTTGRKDLPEIYILVLVSCLYSSFIRVGGSFISVSGIVADFFVCLWQPWTHFVVVRQLYFHKKLTSVTVSIVILFYRANYNNRLLLNNLTRRLESDDVDGKKHNELNCSVELNLICLIAVRSNMRRSTAGYFVPAKHFGALPRTNFIKCVGFRTCSTRFWFLFRCWGFISTGAVKWTSLGQT